MKKIKNSKELHEAKIRILQRQVDAESAIRKSWMDLKESLSPKNVLNETLMDKAGQLRFRNVRAEMYWLMREALDPENPEPISLPPDSELEADLCAVRYKVVTMDRHAAVLMRSKDEIRETLGRSPDKGDSVAMTFAGGIPRLAREARPTSWRDRLKVTQLVAPAVPLRLLQASLPQLDGTATMTVAAPADALPETGVKRGGIPVTVQPRLSGPLPGRRRYS